VSAKSTTDPFLRNALRYTISAKEYETLHKYITSRSKVLKRNVPSVAKVEKLVERHGRDDYNAAAVRAALRVFVATGAGLKLWSLAKERVLGLESSRYVPSCLMVKKKLIFGCECIEGRRYHYGGIQILGSHYRCPQSSSSIESSTASSRVFVHIS
jgi:hypothetical protein